MKVDKTHELYDSNL